MKKAGIPEDFETRGEMLMPTAAFRKLNEEREQQGLSTFANPRNFTAGTVRQLEPSITAQRRLDYFPYMLLQDGRTYFDRHSKTMDALEAAGFKVNPNRKLAKNLVALETHLRAVRQVSAVITRVIEASDSDGTYSARSYAAVPGP